MNRTSVRTSLRSAFLALGFVAGAAAAVRADAINSADATTTSAEVTSASDTVLGYDTTKSYIESKGVTGDASVLKITPVVGGSFLSPSNISLGAFQVAPLGAGQSVTFNNTPFHFLFQADSINGATGISPNETPIDLGGVLNGTLAGNNQSTLSAKFGSFDSKGDFLAYQPADTFTFKTGLYTNTLSLPNNPLAIVPSTTNNGLTTAQAVLSNIAVGAPVPEPSTVVLFSATVAGLAFRHRLRRTRAAA